MTDAARVAPARFSTPSVAYDFRGTRGRPQVPTLPVGRTCATDWTGLGTRYQRITQPIGGNCSVCFLSSVVLQGKWSLNGSRQNRTFPVASGSLASNKRRLIWRPTRQFGILHDFVVHVVESLGPLL